MKSIILLVTILILSSCSKTDCNEEMTRLEKLRTEGWQNCNGSKACIDKVESDYQKKVNDLNCD